MLHRDVSFNNILIYEEITVVDGEKVIRRKGFLSDWELAKSLITLLARQPERIVRELPPSNGPISKCSRPRQATWQFAPIHSLEHPTLPISVPDELEAFFNVVLYHSIRFLYSNLSSVRPFVQKYQGCRGK